MNAALETNPPEPSLGPATAPDFQGTLRHDLLERLAAGKLALPLLPRVATEIMAIVRDPDADAATLAKLIHQDPALAAHVLRIANSPAFLPRSPIVSLQQAITRLGFGTLGEIALAASLQGGVFRVPGFEKELASIWRHALASASFAREVARQRRCNVESSFLCGLLHTIGKPAILQAGIDIAADHRSRAEPAPLIALADELHCEVGRAVAERWGLPAVVVRAISTYRSYDTEPDPPVEPIITWIADRLADRLFTEQPDFDALRSDPAFAHLNLYPEDVDALFARADTVREAVEAMLL
jgi:putative nucleotidyltransferase with HDIG domain